MDGGAQLKRRLDAADPSLWEQEYCREPLELTPADVHAIVTSDAAYAAWLAFRFDAGPPGASLPPLEEAIAAIFRQDGTPLDAYCLVFSPTPWPEDPPINAALKLLENTTACTLKGARTSFAIWLAARTGLAALALGAPERAWALLDKLTGDGDSHVQLRLLACFAPLRGNTALERSPWVQLAIWRLWPLLGVECLPQLPLPALDEHVQSLDDVLDALSSVGAAGVRSLVEKAAVALTAAFVKDRDEEPLVRELRRRALVPGSEPPVVDELPPWFESWAHTVHDAGEAQTARLAGLLLHRMGTAHPDLAAALVLRAARAADIPMLRQCIDAPGLRELLDELATATSNLPPEGADALVAEAIPEHVDQGRALIRLIEHLDKVEAIAANPGGFVAHLVTNLRVLTAARAGEQARALPQCESLRAAVRRAAGQLPDPHTLSAEEVEREASRIEVPELSTALFELALGNEDLPPLERLVQALALRRLAVGTAHEDPWRVAAANAASTAIYDLRALSIFPLRLRLLDEIIAHPHPFLPLADLHFKRANTRQAIGRDDPHLNQLTVDELFESIDLARTESNARVRASAISSLAKMLTHLPADDEMNMVGPRAELEREITEALELPFLQTSVQVSLYQARAHLFRTTNCTEAITTFEQAQKLLTEGDPFWSEIGAEIVDTLVKAEKPDIAVERGLAFLQRSSCAPGVELGMLHMATGHALVVAGRVTEARKELDAGLSLLRGRDWHNEFLGRCQLAQLGIATNDRRLAEEQIRFLRDRQEELGLVERNDLHRLETAVAQAWGGAASHRSALDRELADARDAITRTRVALELARLDLQTTGSTTEPNELLLQAVTLPQDREVESLVSQLVCEFTPAIQPATRALVLEWARKCHHPVVVATLLHHMGNSGEACAHLRDSLQADLSAPARLSCMNALLTMLGKKDRHERTRLCREIERHVENGVDNPAVHLNLAVALHLDANRDEDVLRRAWRYGQSGLARASDREIIQHGNKVLCKILIDLLSVAARESSEHIAGLASWLLEERDVDSDELAPYRLAAVHLLLLPGPFIHPRVLEVADRLMGLVKSSPSTASALNSAKERVTWIECRAAGHDITPSDGASSSGPLDNAPQWLIDLVACRRVEVAPAALTTGLSSVRMALGIRPDSADYVLAELMNGQANLRGDPRKHFLQTVRDCIQRIVASKEREKEWTELERSVVAARRERDHALLGSIEAHIQRQRGAVPAPTGTMQTPIKAPPVIGARQRALQCFDEGVRLMKIVQGDPLRPDAEMLIYRAREQLEEGVMYARKKKMPQLADLVISLGNAWKTYPGADVEKALSLYESAERICIAVEQRAKLWKVHADALLRRGAPDDLRRAERLLERSLDIRRGWERAETLFSAAQIALEHPDLDKVEREIRAAEHLMAAVHAHPSHSEQVLQPLLESLGAWSRFRPDDSRPDAYRNELKAIYPHRQVDVNRPRASPSRREFKQVLRAPGHPAFSAYVAIRFRLMSHGERNADDLAAELGPLSHARIEEKAERESLLGRPDEAERVLATLIATDDDAQPGRSVGKVLLIAHLTRLGRGDVELVRSATEEAITAISAVTDNTVQAMLLSGLAGVWTPDDHQGDPVRDFGLSVNLLRRAMALKGMEGALLDELRGYLARALRYSPEGDIQTNLRESRQLYQEALSRARATEGPAMVANLLHNLGDVESQIGDGSNLDRLRRAEQLIAEAVTITHLPEKKAQYTASLTWGRARIGCALLEESREESIQWLRRAEATFEQVDLDCLSRVGRLHLEGNRTTCTATLARLMGGRSAEIVEWRNRLDSLVKQESAYLVATAHHNLANALMFGEDVLASELTEGLRLSVLAAAVRTIQADARHHWETSFNAGTAILSALRTDRSDLLPWPPHVAWNEARRWFHQAIEAAQALGRGEELAKAAFALGELVGGAASSGQCVDIGEEAWKSLSEASAYLFFDTAHREREARFALHVGITLAYRLAREALSVASSGVAFVLQGDRAEIVRRWMVRSQLPLRRPSRARLMRPAGVTANVWTDWQTALSQRDPLRVNEVLRRIHEVAPSFLSDDGEMGITWRWLEGHPGSIAVSVVLAEPVALVMLAQLGPSEQQRVWIIGLDVPPPPIGAEGFADEMRRAATASAASASHNSMGTWARRHISRRVLRFLGDTPSAILWVPGPDLRLVSPGAIWEGLPVATSMSIELPDLRRSPGRLRSTLVALSDPGTAATDPALRLGDHGLAALKRLVAAAARRGSVRILASAGARFGRALLGDHAYVRDTPASAHDLLAEGIEHDVIVILAHGEMDAPESAALLCIDGSGAIDKLDVEMLARNPNCFAGATILLLSCESGRIGAAIAEPGGIAGTLIAAGARAVVAPIWPVRLDVAAQVGEAVLEGLANGEEPSRILARIQVQGGTDAPLLGRPPPALADRQANEILQRLAFVTWVG